MGGPAAFGGPHESVLVRSVSLATERGRLSAAVPTQYISGKEVTLVFTALRRPGGSVSPTASDNRLDGGSLADRSPFALIPVWLLKSPCPKVDRRVRNTTHVFFSSPFLPRRARWLEARPSRSLYAVVGPISSRNALPDGCPDDVAGRHEARWRCMPVADTCASALACGAFRWACCTARDKHSGHSGRACRHLPRW